MHDNRSSKHSRSGRGAARTFSTARADPQPLRVLKPSPHNLPLQLNSFIGREQELAAVKRLLAATRLLTLTGAGGSGKTRLALQVAYHLLSDADFPDGIWWIDLADLVDPALVPQTVATALAVREQSTRPLLDTLIDDLKSNTALLILDNCEHLLPSCVSLADTLLRACPHLTLLATSREPLRMVGETVWPVSPLSVPVAIATEGMSQAVAAAITESEAVQLFVARAAASLPTFRLTDETAVPVAEICQRLDGLPLAIELAAARVRVLGVADIARRLDSALSLLTRGSATAPPRHQTLRATLDWSYTLLSPAERSLLHRLSVFAGRFTLEAVEYIGADGGLAKEAILDTLANLADKSLVVVSAYADGGQTPMRYRLLEIIRQYSQEKLAVSDESEAVRDRHLAWYLALAERAVPELKGPSSPLWLDRLEGEHDNMRAALRWSHSTGRSQQSLRLAAALHWFWDRRGYFSEGRAWLETALQSTVTLDQGELATNAPGQVALAQARANALLGAAALAFDQGDWATAASQAQASVSLFRALNDKAGLTLALLRLAFASGPTSERSRGWLAEALALAQTLEDKWVVATTWYVVGQGAYFQGDYSVARDYLEAALRLMREVGDTLFLPRVLSTLGGVDLGLEEYPRAQQRLEESLALVRESHDPRAIALVASSLGDVARCRGDYTRAADAYHESLALYRALGNTTDIPAIQHSLGYVALGQGDPETAYALYQASLMAQRDQNNMAGVAEGLAGLAAVSLAQGRLERAARLFGATEALREKVHPMVWPAERIEWRRQVAALRTQLDDALLTAAWTAGRAMSTEAALAYALADKDKAPGTEAASSSLDPAPPPSPHQAEKLAYGGLTGREREVAVRVAQGKSNRAIAAELVIAERTAERHVANIMSKLGFNSRSQIAAWAVEKGLMTSK